MGYETVFGGTNIYPADVTYLALALTADIDLDWPMESAAPPYPMARIIDIIANGPHHIRLPDAREGSPGAVVLFNLLAASSSPCYVTDFNGSVIATLGTGEQWEVYLTDNGSATGPWAVFRFGASTATVQPSALAGYGLKVTGSTLSQSIPVTTFTDTPRDVLPSDRASALVWTGPGTGTLNLPGVTEVDNNFFLSARNAGGGMLNLDPLGTEVIDGGATVALSPGEGVVMVTDGLVWYTLGRGQAAIFAFDYTSIDLTGAPPSRPLVGSELNRIAYRFFGALTTNVVIVVPSTFQQYWVDNATTGAFTLSLNTSTGVAVSVPQGARGIYYCDGAKVVNANTGGIALPISASQGGTGQSAYAVGDLLVASSPSTLAKLSASIVGNALISAGALALPVWGKIDLATMVTGVLPTANGGAGSAVTYTPGSVIFAGAGGVLTQNNANFNWNNTTNVLGVTAISAGGLVVASTAAFSGSIGVGTSTPSARIHVVGSDGGLAFGVSGATKGLRIVPSAGGVSVEGVDQTLGASYQPINLTGSTVHLIPQGGDIRLDGNVYVTGNVQTLLPAVGNVAIQAAGAPNSGLVAFLRPDGVRHGYLGFAPSPAGAIQYINDTGGGHNFGGGTITTDADFRAAGVIYPGNVGSWYLSKLGSNPLINFDANDYMTYNQAGNTVTTVIGGVTVMTLDSLGNFTAAGNVGAYSDAKLKTKLEPITDALTKVGFLTGYTFERVDQTDGRRHAGLIAQDVQQVLPEVVGEHEGTLTVAYGNLVALLVEAIKELGEEVESLKAQLLP